MELLTNDRFDAARRAPQLSFEFFPPATAAAEAQLWSAIELLAPLAPRFVSVTYGAGGSTRERTHATVARIARETPLLAAAHLTCVGASRQAVDAVAARYWEAGVRHVVALRGDPPPGERFAPHPDGYRDAAELVAGLARVAPFEVSVAAHPETHPDAASPAADLANLKRKLDAGARRAITQYFVDPAAYLRFRDRAAAAGIRVPLVPGILPVTNFAQFVAFSARCGARVPSWLARMFDGLDADPEQRRLIAMSVAVEQVRRLQREGVEEFHFYTLNRPELTRAICRVLGAGVAPARAVA